MPTHPNEYAENVFINCPFDNEYKTLFDAIVFAVHIAGFRPRCTREKNAGQPRLETIMSIISESKYAVHDISRTELDGIHSLPRLNMAFELGLDLGARKWGGEHGSKKVLVLDKAPYRYQKFLSDIAGIDVVPHYKSPKQIIRCIRDWLSQESKSESIPGGAYIYRRYEKFTSELPFFCERLNRKVQELTFGEFSTIVRVWLEEDER